VEKSIVTSLSSPTSTLLRPIQKKLTAWQANIPPVAKEFNSYADIVAVPPPNLMIHWQNTREKPSP